MQPPELNKGPLEDNNVTTANLTMKNQINLTNQPACHANSVCRKAIKGVWIAIVAVGFLLLANRSEASYKTVIGGITVSYSGEANAYYDPDDGTLTVKILSDGGSLSVTVGTAANVSWSNGVDVYIMANDKTLKSINIKGSLSCTPYVCGDVWYVSKFALSYGVIGNTVYYGGSFGLGMGSNYVPASVSLKNSYTTAQLFGYPNQ